MTLWVVGILFMLGLIWVDRIEPSADKWWLALLSLVIWPLMLGMYIGEYVNETRKKSNS